jgi:hypothetical protein
MDATWNELMEGTRDAFETAHNCCGFLNTSDRTSCPESRASAAVACSTKLSGRQSELLTWLIAALFTFALVSFLNYLVSHALTRQYTKAKREFNLKQAERRKAAAETKGDKTFEIKKKYSRDEKSVETPEAEPLKTVSTQQDKLKFLPNFMKPTPKPVISQGSNIPRSDSKLTYEEIAAKYNQSNTK